jgi:hypothetical protein
MIIDNAFLVGLDIAKEGNGGQQVRPHVNLEAPVDLGVKLALVHPPA